LFFFLVLLTWNTLDPYLFLPIFPSRHLSYQPFFSFFYFFFFDFFLQTTLFCLDGCQLVRLFCANLGVTTLHPRCPACVVLTDPCCFLLAQSLPPFSSFFPQATEVKSFCRSNIFFLLARLAHLLSPSLLMHFAPRAPRKIVPLDSWLGSCMNISSLLKT